MSKDRTIHYIIINSSRFLSGMQECEPERVEFSGHSAWERRAVAPETYLAAIRNSPSPARRTSWHVLEEGYLDEIRSIVERIEYYGTGAIVTEAKKVDSELSEFLASDGRIFDLALKIYRGDEPQADRLYHESLGETPYSHLGVASLANILLPGIVFPVIEMLVDAYAAGLFPFGVHDQSLDHEYVGPNQLLCLNPLELDGANERLES